MQNNTERFAGRVEDYARYRQRYPADPVLDRLRAWCGLTPQWAIADVGAGTGMLAEVFLENGNPVIAVEPNDAMRAACQRLIGRWPKLKVMGSTAEATELPALSIDMIAVGRAFHWFDQERALAEFRRILKPDGWVVLVSLGRSHEATGEPAGKETEDFERLLIEYGTDYSYVRSGYRIYDKMRAFFDGDFHQKQLPAEQHLDWAAFRGQTMSLSVVPPEGHPGHEIFVHQLRLHFDAYAIDGVLAIPTVCYINAARLSAR